MIPYCRSLTVCILAALACSSNWSNAGPEKARPRSRAFLFTYQAAVTGLPPMQVARIWLPVPSTSTDQDVALIRRSLLRSEGQFIESPLSP